MRFDIGICKNKTEPIRNILDIKNPKMTPPIIFPNKIDLMDKGASSNLSNVFVLLSKTITMVSAEVEPKRTDIAIKPGDNSFIPVGFLITNANAMTMGNNIPQLMFGGFK